jgi:hypothetical protein
MTTALEGATIAPMMGRILVVWGLLLSGCAEGARDTVTLLDGRVVFTDTLDGEVNGPLDPPAKPGADGGATSGQDGGGSGDGDGDGDGDVEVVADSGLDAQTPLDAGSDSGAPVGDGDGDSTMDAGSQPVPPGSSCESGAYKSRTYWFCKNNRDWDQARGDCLAIGGDLATIADSAEQSFIESQIGINQWLVGLNQRNASGDNAVGEWEWTDGAIIEGGYTNWSGGHPKTHECGAINGNGTWRSWNCGNKENYICEVPAP